MAEGDMVCIYCGGAVEDIVDWQHNHPECVEQAVSDEMNHLYQQSITEED